MKWLLAIALTLASTSAYAFYQWQSREHYYPPAECYPACLPEYHQYSTFEEPYPSYVDPTKFRAVCHGNSKSKSSSNPTGADPCSADTTIISVDRETHRVSLKVDDKSDEVWIRLVIE